MAFLLSGSTLASIFLLYCAVLWDSKSHHIASALTFYAVCFLGWWVLVAGAGILVIAKIMG